MDLEQFIESIGELMGIKDEEAKALFLKIDFDNDGSITWQEFSNYVISLGKSQDASANGDVLSHLVNANVASDHEHASTISAAALVAANQWRSSDKYITFSSDGPIHVWNGAHGQPQKLEHPFSLRGPATLALSACALVMYNMAAVASNDEVVRFFCFEPRFKLDLELATPEARAFAMHAFATPMGPLQSMLSFFVWGDDSGRIHVVPEETLVAYRGTSVGAAVAQVKAQDVATANPDTVYMASLFSGWVTAIEFITDFGLYGALAVCSNDANVVIFDPMTRSTSLRFEGHALAVKCLVWVRLYRSIASSGLDREILLWDPKNGHKTGRLLGHKSPVVNLRYYENGDMLFSLDLRYKLHMWDTSKQQLVNVLNTDAGDPFVTKHRFRSQCILLNEARGHLVICGKRPYVWKIREEEKTASGAVVHQHPSVAILHNEYFSQLVSVDVSGLVNIWEMADGIQSASYRVSVGPTKDEQHTEEVTVALLTPTKRCILVGFSNGQLFAYNLQTGLAQNEFVTSATSIDRSSYPIVQAHFSSWEGDAGSGRRKEPNLFATGHALGGLSCVWQWATTLDNASFEIVPLKKMLLPGWRQDWGVDYTGGLDFKDDFLACGRVDGHVIVWNTLTGFIKKDVDHIFWYMDVDGDGVLTYDEVARFLREREGYTEEELEHFFQSADRDNSGEISKNEFRIALDRRELGRPPRECLCDVVLGHISVKEAVCSARTIRATIELVTSCRS